MKSRKYERLICDIDWNKGGGAKTLTFYTWFFPTYLQIIALHREEYRSGSDKNFELDFDAIGRLRVPDLTDPATPTQLFQMYHFSCIITTLIWIWFFFFMRFVLVASNLWAITSAFFSIYRSFLDWCHLKHAVLKSSPCSRCSRLRISRQRAPLIVSSIKYLSRCSK